MTNRIYVAAITVLICLGCTFVSAASLTIAVKTNPQKIVGSGVSVIAVRVTEDGKPVEGQEVRIAVVEGQECGAPDRTTATTAADGTVATALFKGGVYVEDCVARIRVTAERPSPDGGTPQTAAAETTVAVNPDSAAATRIDGFSAIALVLVVSFAIDRLVRGLLFALSYWGMWARRFPDPELDDVRSSPRIQRNQKLIYFLFAASLGMIAIGWFGRVRILGALGFTNVNPWLDILVTGLILAGGADRTEQVLKSLGASGSQADAKPSAPIEITGRLIIDEQGKNETGAERGAVPRSFVLGGSDPTVGV
jgi:hypothetical protein